jgi:DNA-binding CsgD family transcriptional regulator
MREAMCKETDSDQAGLLTVKGMNWYPLNDIALLELLFPGWVISRWSAEHRLHFLSRNSAAFFGFSFEELAAKTSTDFLRLIHPDDQEPYQRISQRLKEIVSGISPVDMLQYRFTIQYRLRRNQGYLYLHEERLFHLNEHNQLTHFALFRDLSAERGFSRVQLDWYKVHELGYQRINSYVPAAPEQELTVREMEVIQLIREGLSSKEIADRMCISVNTVRNHRSNLFRKTHARNVVDLVKNTAPSERLN